jgi:hypothetical protein
VAIAEFSARKIYSYAPGDATPTDITGSVITLSGANIDYFEAVYWCDTSISYEPWIIMTNGIDAPIKWNGTGDCAVLGGSPPVGARICAFKGHIYLSSITDGSTYRQRDQRNNVDDAEDWSAGTAGVNDLRQSAGEIMANLIFGDFRFIFKEDSISLCRPTGYNPPVSYDEDFLPVGTPAPRTVTKIWRYDLGFFLGNDLNVYIIRKDGFYDPIGDDIVKRIRDWPNDEYLKYSFSVYYPGIDQILLFLPSSNSDTGYLDRAFAFNLEAYIRDGSKIWSTPIEVGIDITAGAIGRFRNYYTIAELADLYDTLADAGSNALDTFYQDAAFSELVVGHFGLSG